MRATWDGPRRPPKACPERARSRGAQQRLFWWDWRQLMKAWRMNSELIHFNSCHFAWNVRWFVHGLLIDIRSVSWIIGSCAYPRFGEHAEHVVEHFFEKVEDKAMDFMEAPGHSACRAFFCSKKYAGDHKQMLCLSYGVSWFQWFQLVSPIATNKFVNIDTSTGVK